MTFPFYEADLDTISAETITEEVRNFLATDNNLELFKQENSLLQLYLSHVDRMDNSGSIVLELIYV